MLFSCFIWVNCNLSFLYTNVLNHCSYLEIKVVLVLTHFYFHFEIIFLHQWPSTAKNKMSVRNEFFKLHSFSVQDSYLT